MNGKPRLRAAVVGAGVSGIITAAHLDESGVDVTVFERLAEPGGIWYEFDDGPLKYLCENFSPDQASS
jgi:cation diffusion facilitator CzcD-associated flavoprotein CzcO